MRPAAVRRTPESHNMLILLDQDNVLADFESGFRRHWRNRFGEDAPIEGKEHLFYIRDRLPEHLQAYAAELYGTVGFFESLPPVSGAVEAARALLAAGHDVRICTAPVNQYRYCAGEKIAWVEQHLGTEWTRRVIIAKDKPGYAAISLSMTNPISKVHCRPYGSTVSTMRRIIVILMCPASYGHSRTLGRICWPVDADFVRMADMADLPGLGWYLIDFVSIERLPICREAV